jgi:hypothetical protein
LKPVAKSIGAPSKGKNHELDAAYGAKHLARKPRRLSAVAAAVAAALALSGAALAGGALVSSQAWAADSNSNSSAPTQSRSIRAVATDDGGGAGPVCDPNNMDGRKAWFFCVTNGRALDADGREAYTVKVSVHGFVKPKAGQQIRFTQHQDGYPDQKIVLKTDDQGVATLHVASTTPGTVTVRAAWHEWVLFVPVWNDMNAQVTLPFEPSID